MSESVSLLQRLEQEAQEVMKSVEQHGLRARLLGGIAIRFLLGDRLHEALRRPIADVDLIVAKRDSRELGDLLTERGWQPFKCFNALNGARRLLFGDSRGETQIDVFVGSFEMCHKLPLAEGLQGVGYTLPATDLLMSKLQIVELNVKDRSDLYALLLGCRICERDDGAIDPNRIVQLTSRDWGLHHTFELNLATLQHELADTKLSIPEIGVIRRRIDEIEVIMQQAPKSRTWKLRAKLGERKRWYERPEEVERDGAKVDRVGPA